MAPRFQADMEWTLNIPACSRCARDVYSSKEQMEKNTTYYLVDQREAT